MDCKVLNELFKEWKKEQGNEPNDSCEKTFPKNANGQIPNIEEYKSSFCVDGFLSDKFNGVLFVLKESNTEGNPELNDTFWFKDCQGAKRWKLYRNSMIIYLEKCVGKGLKYQECAYMNLNKRGGYGKCNDEQLTNYVNNEKYKQFILKQIEIINPKHIICCGSKTVYRLVLSIIKDTMPSVEVYDCYHLSCSKRVYTQNNAEIN